MAKSKNRKVKQEPGSGVQQPSNIQQTNVSLNNRRIGKLTRENKTLKSMREESSETICTMQREINRLTEANSALTSTVEQLENKHAESEEESLDQDGSESDSESDKDVEGYERRITRKKTKIAQLRDRLDQRKKINQLLQDHNELLQERLATKKIKSQALKAEHKELEASKRILQQSVEDLESQLDEDQTVIMDLLRENVELKKPVATREQNLADAHKEQLIRHDAIVSELYEEINRLRNQIERAERAGSVDSMDDAGP